MVKPGGKLVYATCSILPSENEFQVQKFLAAHAEEWTLEEEMKINPAESGHDGFYGARLVRKAAAIPAASTETVAHAQPTAEAVAETPSEPATE
jgi:16S rRNA (cytosine967-C5)-methyltransferase